MSASAAAQQDTDEAHLSVRDIHAFCGESYIVQGVSFDLAENGILALLGRNGAGKTTTLRTLARLGEPHLASGAIHLGGRDLTPLKSHEAAGVGVALVPEDRRIISGLTVEENLKLAQIAPPRGRDLARIYQLFPRREERRRQEGVTLSGGEQQMLAIARAPAHEVRLLLLDEPYEGLASVIVGEIEKTLRIIREEGVTTILVAQNAVRVLTLAEHAVILDTGSVVLDGTAGEVLEDEALGTEYLAI